ncbi:MAG: reverse transcriptase domain-containing protein, partial [Candidatus Phytoplasma australasiaticum]|nr:reverse transcriptase domain-containing protein [Candidatus Phytoplasma australasiaticum]
EIMTNKGILQRKDLIGDAAVTFYTEQFREVSWERDDSMLHHIPQLINKEENDSTTQLPEKDKVRSCLFSLNESSASGPDRFTSAFFQVCWDIIGEDLTRLVRDFLYGQELTKFVTHINLLLIPKKDGVKDFSDLRPINLSTFTNKLISRVVHGRLVKVMPKMISQNQSGFVKGRNIAENVLLA